MTAFDVFEETFGRGCNTEKATAAMREASEDYNWPICGQCGETFCECEKCENHHAVEKLSSYCFSCDKIEFDGRTWLPCGENCPCGQCCELIDEPTIQAVHGLGVAAGMVR